jgi:hypothetical protein
LSDLIGITIEHFIAGARVVLPQILSKPDAPKKTKKRSE